MKSLLLMITFFTRIPVRYNYEYKEKDFIKGIKLFPIVGVIIGLLMYIPAIFADKIHRPVLVLLMWSIYIWVTGAIHIDGLSDTFDGIFSNRDRKRILEIMKDSRIGTFGVLGILVLFAWNLVISNYIDLLLLAMAPVVGRSSAMLSAYTSNYAREGEGMGKAFIENCGNKEIIFSSIFIIIMNLFIGFPASIIALLLTYVVVLLLTRYIKNIIGGTTGDTIGFIIEISQAVFILFSYLIRGVL